MIQGAAAAEATAVSGNPSTAREHAQVNKKQQQQQHFKYTLYFKYTLQSGNEQMKKSIWRRFFKIWI